MSVLWIRAAPDGPDWSFRVGRDGDELVAEWANVGVLRSNRSGTDFRFDLVEGVDPALGEKHRRGHVEALLRHLRGGLTLHASVVAREGNAVAILGDSGSGKSTMAATLCARDGVELVADDCARICADTDGISTVTPTDDVTWLTVQSARALGIAPSESILKLAWTPPRLARSPATLRLVVAIGFDDALSGPVMQPVQGMGAFRLLSDNSFRFVVDEPRTSAEDLDRLARLLTTTRLARLDRPRRWGDLGATADAIAEAAWSS